VHLADRSARTMRCTPSALEYEFDTAGKRTRRHAGIFMGYGEQRGRPGIFVLDQFDGTGRQRGDDGRTGVRFLPFERPSGQGGYLAGEFCAIRPAK
jgi:hypothetical protein